MKTKIYIDGREGTTGLQIDERLRGRTEFSFIEIDPAKRKDTAARAACLQAADIAILCLPDAASREAVSLIQNDGTRVIDASTAFRTADGWVYGFPELRPGQREKIAAAKRVAVPGCHATGFTAAVHPLRAGGILSADAPLCCQSVSGYTGGGKKLIALYETGRDAADTAREHKLHSPRFYALGLAHKHLPEMVKINGLSASPLFTPLVSDYPQGMLVSLPLRKELLAKPMDASQVRDYYADYYKGSRFVSVRPFCDESALDGGFLDPTALVGTNQLEIFVFGHDDQILVFSRLDNLGKGASGAAVQCLNLMCGLDEGTGLQNAD